MLGWWGREKGRTHHESEAPLQVDVADAAVALEKPLHILLPGGRVQPPDEDAAAAHGCVCAALLRGQARQAPPGDSAPPAADAAVRQLAPPPPRANGNTAGAHRPSPHQ